MKIHQIRNATMILDYGEQKILVDPMLAPKGKIPSLKWVTKSRVKNPLVELPPETDSLLASVTHVLITHCQKGHFDHLDRTAVRWIKENKLLVLCESKDEDYLRKMGLNVQALNADIDNPFFKGQISLIPCRHGKGLIGSLMSHGYGYIISVPNQPRVYIVGDSIFTEDVQRAITDHKPDIVVMPGGGAKFDIGEEVIMGIDDVLPMAKTFTGTLIVNHLEALDHCPVTREQVMTLAREQRLEHRLKVPKDGEAMIF